MLENKLYLDIKSTANRFHWIANYSISCTESKLEAPYKDSINHSETKWGTPVQWGWFLLFSRSGGHKTKETYPTRPGSPTPCKQGLKGLKTPGDCKGTINKMRLIVATLNPASGVQLKSDAHTCKQRSFSHKTLRPASPAIEMKSLLISKSALVCKNDDDKVDRIQFSFCNRLARLPRLCFANWF